jgi:DNA-binding MarR family transcriptional regulator
MTSRANQDRVRPATRWLSPQEREAWLGLIRLVTTLPAALDAQLDRDAGLNFFEYSVLAMLSEQPTRTLQMGELASVTNSSLSRLSNVVKRLEQRGLVHREPAPHDRRCIRAVLSESGMRTVVAAAPRHVEAVRELVIDAVSPAQLRQLRAAHELILSRLDPAATTHPARLEAEDADPSSSVAPE